MNKIHFIVVISLLNFIIMICSFVLYNESSCTRSGFCFLNEEKLKELISNKLNNRDKTIQISEICGTDESSYDNSGVVLGGLIITMSIISGICGIFTENTLVSVINFIYCVITLSCASVIINLCNSSYCDSSCNTEQKKSPVKISILNTLMGTMTVVFMLIITFSIVNYDPF